MDEILQEFCKDTGEILKEVSPILEELENNPANFKALEAFGQKIDRIMGAAQSLQFETMGLISQLCKSISYKAAQSKNLDLISIVVAFLFDAVEALEIMNEELKKSGQELLPEVSKKTILSRLNFISNKLKDIQRSSVAVEESGDLEKMYQQFSKIKS